MDPNSDVSKCPILGRLPSKLSNRLLPFQREGVRYAVGKNGRCLIADEMGLGKTIQAIAVAYYYKDEWPLLIIVPSSLKFCWIEELEKWLPDILPHQINLVQCGNDASGLATSLITIVTYGLLRLPSSKVMREAITACKFKIIICDESHYLKNIKTLSSKTIIPLLKSTTRRILLSGTPALAKPVELYPQIDAICPGKFGSFWQYTDRYCNAHTVYYGKFKKRVVDGASNLEELQQRLKNMLMIRREKSEVLTELPPKQRQRVLFELKQSTLKKEILDKFAELKQKIHKGSNTLQQVLQGAEESSSHAADAEGLEQEKNDENLATDEPNTSVHSQISKLYKLSGEAKIGPVREYIEMLCDNEQLKFLVFAFHHDMMDGVQQTLWEKKVKFVRIDGHTKGTDRQAFVHQFQSDPDTRVAILSILAAGVGLTFTAAKLVVFAELYWTPGVMLQCEDRAHRIGQTCSLPVHYLVARGTMDEWVWSAVCKKTVVTSTALTGKSRQLEHNEGDKYQVDLLSNADVWNPEEGETLVNVSQLFQSQRPDDQSSILEFFPSQRDPEHGVGGRKPAKHEADSTKTTVNIKSFFNGDKVIGKSKVTDETKLKAKSRKRDKQSSTTALSKSNKLKVPDILIISDDEDEFKPAVKKKRLHDNLCQKGKKKTFNKLNVQRDTNTTSEAVSKEGSKGVSTLKSYMNRYDLDFEGEIEAEMKSDEEPFDSDGLAITNSEKFQHGGSCGDETDGSNAAVTESCLSQLSDGEAYSENKVPIMSQAHPHPPSEGNSSQQTPHVDSQPSQSPEMDREVNCALNDNSMSPTHLSSPSRPEQNQQTPRVNKCNRCISNSEKITDDGKASSETNQWSCAACTFLNHSELPQCEMCDTPKRKGLLRKSQTDRPKSSESSPDTDGESPNLPSLTSKNCQIGLTSHNLDVDFITAHDEQLNPEPDRGREDKFTIIRKGTKPEEVTSKSEASTTIHHVHEEMQHTSSSVTTSRIEEISADICDNEVSSINSLPSLSISTVNQMKVLPNTVVQDLQGQCESPDLFDDDVDEEVQENAVIECDGKSAEGDKSPVIEDFDSEESDIEDLTSLLSNSTANCAQLPVSNSSLAIPATTDKSLQVHLPTSSNVITVTSCVASLPSAASLQSSSAQLPSPTATTSVLDNISASTPLSNDLKPLDEISVSQISQKNTVSGKTDVQSQQTQDPTHKELKFSCSVHTGRIYVYDKGGNSLNANFHPVDVEVGNTSDLAEILQIPQHLRLLQKFIREWSSLTDNKKRMIAKRGLIFTSPLAAYEEVKTVQGSKQRHLSKEDNLATAMRNASRVQGSVRVISKHSACPVNITTEFQENDLSSVRGIAQTVTENGVPLCLQCHQPYSNPLLSSETISKPENAWQFRLCSYACMDKYWTLTKASYCRDQIYAVERGVCRICHYDAHAFFQQIKITKDISTKAELIKKSPYNSLTSKQRQKMVEQPQAGQFWHVDHITPVWQGGGMCDLDNLRTLCTPCHLKVTRRQAGQRATMKKLSGAASQGDITAFFQKS